MLKRPLLVLSILASPLAAQAPTASSTPPEPPTAKLQAGQVVPYHHVFRMLSARVPAPGQEAAGAVPDTLGVLDDQVVFGKDAQGQPAIIRIQSITSPAGVMLDSSIADAATLVPRHHSSYSAHRQLRIDFSPTRVTGEFSSDGRAQPVSHDAREGMFDSNMLDVLIGALPLAAGYTGRLLVYIYEAGGPIPMDVSVRGSQDLKGTDTWVTSVTLGRSTVVYYIGKTDHQVKQLLAPGMRLVPAQP